MRPGRVRRLAILGALTLVVPALVLPAAAVAVRPAPRVSALSAVVDAAPTRPTAAPDGWRVVPVETGVRVVWRSRSPVPLRDAAVEFSLGGRLLGIPRPGRDGHTYVLQLDGPLPGPARSLEVTAGGVPLDAHGRSVLPRSTTSPPVGAEDEGPVARRSAFDPGVPGPYATTRTDYDLGGVDVGGFAAPTEVVGAVVSPVAAPGPRPLVLILHGRHSTCFKGGPDGRSSGDWPCRPGWQPIPSHLGYLDAQELLASQGYVTVSIAANGVNGQDWEAPDGGAEARSELVRHHLALWHTWATAGGGPFGDDFVGHVDLDHVLLVGHSRGGEGVNRAAIDSRPADPWQIDGQVLIGPTAFGRQTALGVDTTVLLPYCDGDVSDLQGQQYVDQVRDLLTGGRTDPALRSAVLVMGANHNYFNQEWTPGESAAPSSDDWWNGRDPTCGRDARLAPASQRNVGAVYIAASAAAFVDRRASALPLLNGTPARPASLGDATTHVSALGARRQEVYFPASTGPEPRAVGADAAVCEGYRDDPALPTCLPRSSPSPNFLPMYGAWGAPAPQALRVSWTRAGGRVGLPLGTPVDLHGATSLEMRVAVAGGGGPARFGVEAVDESGTRYPLGVRTVRQLPGKGAISKAWGQTVRLGLPAGPGAPLSTVRALRLTPVSRHGSLVLLDVQGHRAGWSRAPVPSLPRVDVVDRTIVEGDGGARTERVRVRVTGTASGTEQVWVQPPDPDYSGVPGYPVTLAPGQTVIDVPISVVGDDRDDYDVQGAVIVKALRDVVTGHYAGSVRIRDDDPAPVLHAERTWQTVAEGQRLRWDLTLSAPSDKWVGVLLAPMPPDSGIELTLADIGVRFRQRHGYPTGDRQVPLSQTRLRLWTSFEPGEVTGSLGLPTRVDGVDEGTERVVLGSKGNPDVRFPWLLRGLVTDS